MATYYVTLFGSDLNNGTSPSSAWRTLTKALGANGIGSGDIVYVGAGIYREVVTVNMNSPTSETQIIGDIDGSKTGYAGEIQLTAYGINDDVAPPISATVLSLTSKNFLTFRNIVFIGGGVSSGSSMVTATTCTNLNFYGCVFNLCGRNGNGISNTVNFGVSANCIVDSCIFFTGGSSSTRNAIIYSLTTGAGLDYDAKILITNCIFYNGTGVGVNSSGTLPGEGGGVTILNCSFFCSNITTNTTRIGGAFFIHPVRVYNCFILSGPNLTALNSAEQGAIVENYNVIHSGSPRVNVLIGPQSVADGSVPAIMELGQSFLYGFRPRPFGMPSKNSPLLSQGNVALSPRADMLGNNRQQGNVFSLFKGVISSGTNLAVSDSSTTFPDSGLQGYTIKIFNNLQETKTINSNSGNIISGDGKWINSSNTGFQYSIFQGPTSLISKATSGTNSTLVDNQASWGPNFWQGYTCRIVSGTAINQNFIVSGNSANTLTGYSTMSVTPVSGDIYELFWGSIYSGTVSSSTVRSITDNNAGWGSNPTGLSGVSLSGIWLGQVCMITSGSGSGAYIFISGHGPQTLTGYTNFSKIPGSGDKYVIYPYTGNTTGVNVISSGFFPMLGRNIVNCSVGAFESYNVGIKETGIVLSGSNSVKLFGSASHEFKIPVSGIQTTISVYGYYNEFYTGIKPQLIIQGGNYIGVEDTTGTMSGGSGQWEKISVSIIPSGYGILRAKIVSNSSGVGGITYFDAFNIS
jgi:hypothetical protein